MCSIAYYLMSFLSKAYQIVTDKSFDRPGHWKDVLDGLISFQKQYLDTWLRIFSTAEVENIDSKCMHVHAMTEKREVIFYKA